MKAQNIFSAINRVMGKKMRRRGNKYHWFYHFSAHEFGSNFAFALLCLPSSPILQSGLLKRKMHASPPMLALLIAYVEMKNALWVRHLPPPAQVSVRLFVVKQI